MDWLGIDFGTSNTAAAVMQDGRVRVIELEPGRSTLPTAVFLDFAGRRTLYGSDAAAAMIDGLEGRFMRALKSILGTPLAREKRQFLNERVTLIEIIGRFLAEVKRRAELGTGRTFRGAMSGRPVHFHSRAPGRDAQALADLKEAYLLAGFDAVRFLPEPEAAALANGGAGRGLIVDIGGGTSDFTVFERDDGRVRILASHGVRIGGTDFDRALSLAHAMPLLGLGTQIGKELGEGSHAVPKALFHKLASWEQIAFVYGREALGDARRWRRLALEPERFARLETVLDMHLGHDIAYAVEAGKIAVNDAGGAGAARIDLAVVERGLAPRLEAARMARDLSGFAAEIGVSAEETLAKCGVTAQSIERVVFVGGSSLLALIRAEMARVLPGARQETSEVFTAVVDGLAIAAGAAAVPVPGACDV